METRLSRHPDNRLTVPAANWIDQPCLSDRVRNEATLHSIERELTRGAIRVLPIVAVGSGY